ncbi:MAG: DNA polymerase III subunit gamma/tau [Desulfobacterales bacterium]|nr:DNA polymerase III subunit gamma/tau [Desulfobacterales bacterium]
MSYLVLARKYRPQTFDQVIKQDHVTRTLTNAIASNRIAHAILFSGPRGTGKTTIARILAKAMNCKKGPTPVPCNGCRSCDEITSGSAIDVFEIDGASNNSVDQIRDLRENIKYMPAHCLYKIYIIDEVHMLSTAAFNALLKTLEEPPAHAMFIFATTEPHKIPTTILSRCQIHNFKLIDVESLAAHMEMICNQEAIKITKESLRLIAREAGGSMRDALSLLDQVMAFSEGDITHAQVLNIIGVIDRKIIFEISEAILRADISEILNILDTIYDAGYDIKRIYADIIEHFRNLLVVKIGKNINQLINLPVFEIELLIEQAKDVSAAFLSQSLDFIFQEENTIRISSRPKLALEMVLIKMIRIKPALPIEVLIEKLDSLKNDIQEKADCNSIDKVVIDHRDLSIPNEPTGTAESKETFGLPSSDDAVDFNEETDTIWQRVLDSISEKHPSLAANLSKSKLKKLNETSLEIEVCGSEFNRNMISRKKNLAIIEEICRNILKRENIKLVINHKETQNNDIRGKKSQTGRLKQQALSHPLVADTIEIFNGKIVDVKIL